MKPFQEDLLAKVLRAGLAAAGASFLVLAGIAMLAGYPFWMVLNVSTQAFFGPEVALLRDLDLVHSGFGLLIHVGSCMFWAFVAALLLAGIASAPAAGFGTALMALVLDYVILPESMSPGWHLIMPFPAVILGFAAMGAGLWLGLRHRAPTLYMPLTGRVFRPTAAPDLSATGPEALRHPAPDVLDQRQQRIDPANEVTRDPNARGILNRKQPGGSAERR